MVLNNLNNSGDLRSRLGKPKTKTQFRDPIQVVVTNTNVTRPKRDKSEAMRDYQKDLQASEREEGEWQDSEDENNQEDENEEEQKHARVLIEEYDEEEREEEGEQKEDEENSDEEDNDVLAKEVQGPKGSVIKVVPPKPRIASTVWARLNNVKSEINDSYLKNR